MNSEKNHSCRKKVLSHPKIIADKKEATTFILERIQQKQTQVATAVESIVRDNKRCEEKLLDTLHLPLDTVVTEETFIDITLDQMHEAKIHMLTALINIKMNSNINTHVVIASLKGNPVDVRNKVVKTKEPLLLEQAHKTRTLKFIDGIPTAEYITHKLIPADVIECPVSLTFNNNIGMCDYPDLEWYRGVASSVKSIEYNKTTLLENLNLYYVSMTNDDVKFLS